MKRTTAVLLGLAALALSPLIAKPADAQTVSCSGVAAWSANSVNYAIGALVTYNGSEYKCIQTNTSETGWDPVDVPALWSLVGTCSTSTTSTTTGATCSAVPGAPGGLSASGTTSSGTTLSWSAVTPPSNCSITSYTIYKSGTSIGTSTGTSFAVSGLSASTNYSFTVAASDSDGTGSQSSSVSVTTTSSGTSEAPYGGTPAAIPGTVQAENYDTGGQGVAYNVTSTNGSDNGYRSDGIDLEACTDTGGGVDLGWTAAGQWFRYTVNVASAGTYTATFRVANGATASGSFHIQNSSGTNLSGAVNVAVTGGWQTWTSVTANVTLPAGQQVLTVSQDTGNYNINYISFAAQSTGEAPYGGSPAAIPGTVQAENYDTGGQGVAYNATSTNGTDNGYRSDGIDLETTTDTGGGVDLGWTAAGQWFKYTVNVASAGTYTATFRVADGATAAGSLHIQNSSGANLTGAVNVAVTGGWQTWTNVTANLTLPAGQQVLEVYQDTGNYNINYISFTSGATSCTSTPSAPGGLSASGTTSSGTNLSWNSVGAPANCSISGYTVYENGTAIATVSSGTSYSVSGLAASTTYSFTVAAVDSDGTGAKSSSVSVTTSPVSSSGPITNSVIGYWDNWGTFTMPNTSMNFHVLNYAFAVGSGTDGATLVMWTPSATNPLSNAAADIASTKAQGRTVLLSLGGATSPNITLLNSTDVSNFVSSVEGLVSQYGFQGIDLDFENSSVTVNAGDSLTNPTTPDIANLASALNQIKSHFGSSFVITYVPETADIDAYAAFSGEWGGYLALIGATRNILTYVDTQCYDSGSMNAANGQIVAEGGADFPVAMSELLLHGYTITGGQNFAALSQSQVAFGNLIGGPTSSSAAVAAWNYLTKGTPDGGSYTLLGGPYPNMAGVMTWDANADEANGYSFSNALVADGMK